jgi:hypothetical protein
LSKTDGRRDAQSNTRNKLSAEQPSVGASVIDVLDRVLDKGIVIDAWVKVQLVGIDLLTVEARMLVASIETYLQQAEAVSQVGPFAASQFASINPGSGMLRNIDGYLNPNIDRHLKPKVGSQKPKIGSHLKMSPKPSHAPRRHRH